MKIFQSFGYLPYLWALIRGVTAGVEHTSALNGMKCRTVIDIGASCGQFALVTRRCFPQALIVSFEPLVGPAKIFRALFQKDPNVIFHQKAIGPYKGETILHVAGKDDSSSLLPITPLQNRLFPGTYETRTEIVNIGPLNEFVETDKIVSPGMLKLDVQGYELQALQGCENLLEKFSYVYVECSFVELYSGQALAGDIIAWLWERGWCLNGIYNMTCDSKGKSVQADFLFDKLCFASAVL